MNPPNYTPIAIGLHWLIALLVFSAFPLGIYMHNLPFSPRQLQLISYHKWLGVTIFMLALLRVLWRMTHPAPPLPATMPAWQRRGAVATHHLLYLLLIVIPLSGWAMSSAKGVPVVYLGLVPLPDLLGKDKALGELLARVHQGLNLSLAVLVLTHVLAALKHHFLDRDEVLVRMIPLLKPWRKP